MISSHIVLARKQLLDNSGKDYNWFGVIFQWHIDQLWKSVDSLLAQKLTPSIVAIHYGIRNTVLFKKYHIVARTQLLDNSGKDYNWFGVIFQWHIDQLWKSVDSLLAQKLTPSIVAIHYGIVNTILFRKHESYKVCIIRLVHI